ncbi:Autoinducer 2 import system permease protein LsrD [Phycisphaerales bacterium]|nr:Autoinducer 2 import system permease protein LsrD [Phycisphaerales bacterium]
MTGRDRAARVHFGVLAGLALILFGFAAWLEPSFIAPATQRDLSLHAFELALLALPMTCIIVSGGIDLSVGSICALAAVVMGLLHEAGAPIWAACIAAIGAGAVTGALNGAFIAALRVHPLIVTLATMAAFRGLAEGLSRARPISGFPPEFTRLGEGYSLGLPIPILALAIISLAAGLALSRTSWGCWMYAIGSNERGARYAGLPVDRIKIALYACSGTAAALAGIVFAARRNTAKADIGSGLELEVITAVVLGGTSIFGGRGSIAGTLLGVLIIHETRELVSWHWHHDELILLVTGTILVASVLLNNLASRRAD